MTKSIVITGANRGIGLGLVFFFFFFRNCSRIPSRNAPKSPELQALNDPRLVIVEMDATCDDSFTNAALQVAQTVGSSGVDILISNAGVIIPVNIDAPINRKEAIKNFDVNCIATMAVTLGFKYLLKAAAKKAGHSQVVNMSSILGSVSQTWGAVAPRHFTVYSMSKAALNMYTKTLSMEWKADGIRATSIHPGWVQTDMGGEEATLTVEQSTSDMAHTIMKFGEANNGLFYDWKFEAITW
ncbi:hypothetical protein PFISCL1PPCAC_14010 [Pristionchus fissidentatus]|uniref:Dehydrogenase n=1 Tax=Pristionchus fissidentatus TaxID=1538716 RepID=A0AAV5VTE3_9BILA|nr:hypothetical protein PFISCL1PPCAC_14010 [Pristionchus fissidentatus]